MQISPWPKAGMAAVALALAAMQALVAPGRALANDTMAVMPAGGLVFVKSADVEMRAEDLFISRDVIEVHYVFANTSDRDVTATIAFPLPEVTPYVAVGVPQEPAEGLPGDNFVGFAVSVDGRPVKPDLVQQAFVGKRDVTALLREAGLPVSYFNTKGEWAKKVEALPLAARQKLKGEGVLGPGPDGDFDEQFTVRSSFTWAQTFPAGREVKVAHRYVPVAGADWFSETDARSLKAANDQAYKSYCIDEGTLAGLRRKLAGGKPDERLLRAWLVEYVLTTGANWKGPIGRFHLTIEKPTPTSILSTCFTGLKKTGPTRFEFSADNYQPVKDLKFAFFVRLDEAAERRGEVRQPAP